MVCGALTLEDGAKVVALRSRELVALAGRGGMAVVELAASEVTALLEQDGDGLSVAVVNTPGSTVVSGDAVAIGAFVERMQSDGVFCRRVEVDYASHSAQVDPILASLSASLADVTGQPVSVPMVSTVTGAQVEGPELDGAYWCRNLRAPVRLDRALEALQAEGHGVFVEVSAHPVLAIDRKSVV